MMFATGCERRHGQIATAACHRHRLLRRHHRLRLRLLLRLREDSFILSPIRTRSGATRRTGPPALARPMPISCSTGSNFLPCRGGPFALCYYSGPSTGPEDLSCTLTPDGLYANCQCFDIPFGVYFVDINAILNHSVYENTVAQCGIDGSLCQTTNSAPVCHDQSGDVDSRELISFRPSASIAFPPTELARPAARRRRTPDA